MKNKSYDKALFRIIRIISMLAYDDRPKIEELAKEFNVGIRTIQRDIYERMNSLPITKDNYGCLKFNDGFSLKNSVFSNDEIFVLNLAFNFIKKSQSSYSEIVDNLRNKIFIPE